MSECIICGRRANTVMDGAMLCPQHYGDAQAYAERQRQRGRTVSIIKWASQQREATTLRLTPMALAKATDAAKSAGISRNEWIERAILAAE